MSNRQNASLYTLNFTLNTSPIITGEECMPRKFKIKDRISGQGGRPAAPAQHHFRSLHDKVLDDRKEILQCEGLG